MTNIEVRKLREPKDNKEVVLIMFKNENNFVEQKLDMLEAKQLLMRLGSEMIK